MIRGWLSWRRRTPANGEARRHLEAARRRRPEVDALTREIKERRASNRFAPALEQALRARGS